MLYHAGVVKTKYVFHDTGVRMEAEEAEFDMDVEYGSREAAMEAARRRCTGITDIPFAAECCFQASSHA
jgi:hypothetical protein